MKKKNIYLLLLLWILFILGSFFVNTYFVYENNKLVVKEASRSFFGEILTTRAWNASHGGVYVPITETTHPNKYLTGPDRDITTTDGLKLTKINPAFMTRQIAELADKGTGIKYHITSSRPIRPENRPDSWEVAALQTFESGNDEVFEMVDRKGSKVFRYMAPLFVEQSCLKCHGKQNYHMGQIRGGISVTIASAGYYQALNKQIWIVSMLHILLLIAGCAGILLFQNRINRQFKVIVSQNDELQKNINQKDRLFTLLAHDLKSPLSGAMGLGEEVRSHGSEMTKENIIELNNHILSATQKTYQLSEQLVAWYQAHKGSEDFNPSVLQLEPLISQTMIIWKGMAKEKEIEISLNVPRELTIYADQNMISAIVRNLVGNALKYTTRGGRVMISANRSETEGFVEITVADTGIGMTDEIRQSILNTDFQKSKPGTENEKGSGIGLLLSKEFIKQNKGELRIVSEPGSGATFTFLVPASKTL